ncbi:MAG: hypothetical protein MZU97_12995 [Bacillus subtilis]|nr:hypothetical protein [Bacillus subtilis]
MFQLAFGRAASGSCSSPSCFSISSLSARHWKIRVRVVVGEVYERAKRSALYLFKYGKLPRNYITKAVSNAAFISYYVAMDYGLNIGGDIVSI